MSLEESKLTYIPFKANTAKKKPNTILNHSSKCPFCDRSQLAKEKRFLKETDDFLIVKNKYPVMENAFATVVIEHKDCDQHIATYSLEYLTALLMFAIDYYRELESSSKFTSIAFFKNHGIFSGGSIKHPHMQIIGFENTDYNEDISSIDFEGESIISNQLIDWNLSTFPRSEGYEINLTINDGNRIDLLAAYLQKSVKYVLECLNTKHQCYNLAFYIKENKLKVKIISRGPTSVLLLGFGIHQTPNNLKEIAQHLKEYQ